MTHMPFTSSLRSWFELTPYAYAGTQAVEARASLFIRICAAIVACAGLIVVYGWLTQNAPIVQIRPEYSSMKFNTATSLALLGFSLLAAERGMRRIAMVLAVLAAALPFGTLLEYISGVDVGVDNIFVTPFLEARVRHSGRMAPNTLAALLLTASAIFVFTSNKSLKRYTEFFLATVGSVIVALGIVPLVGYIGGIQTAHTWGDFAGMAMHTSICFVLLGSGVIACAWKRTSAVPGWLPIPVATGCLVIALSMWTAVREYENMQFDHDMAQESAYITSRAMERLTSYYAAIDRIARRWTIANGTSRNLWEDDAQEYLKAYTFTKAVEWVDEGGTLQWVIPMQGNEKLVGSRLDGEGTRGETLRQAVAAMEGHVTQPIDLLQGGKGFLYMTPVTANGKYNGVVVAAFVADDIFNGILSRSSLGSFYLTASQDGQVFFDNTPVGYAPVERWQKTVTIKNRDKTWTVIINPTPEMIASLQSPLPGLVLVTGLLTAVFATFAILLAIRSRQAAGILRKSEDRIKRIVVNHSMLASADFNLRRFMGEAVESMRDLTPATGAVIELVEDADMVYCATSGSAKIFTDMRMKRAGSLSGRCVERRETMISLDTSNDPNVNAQLCNKVGVASMALAPLIQRGNVVGVLKILSSRPYAFGQQDVQTLQLMAGLIGGALGQQMEIERRERLEEQLRHLAHNDSLTSLPNRMLFKDRLSHAILNNARVGGIMAVMYMDVDHFKTINDVYGHAEGDALLQQFSARISGLLRKGDTLARLGGDEFTIIAENLKSADDAEKIASKIVGAVRDPFDLPSVTLKVSISIGVAVTKEQIHPDAFLARADEALYQTKRKGRNGFTVAA